MRAGGLYCLGSVLYEVLVGEPPFGPPRARVLPDRGLPQHG
jgi:hypothetical protein